MTFATMLPGFAALAGELTGLQIVNAHMPSKAIDPRLKGRLEFRVIACKAVSEVADELRYADSGDDLILTTYGPRVVTIQVKFEGYDNGPGQDALFYLERLGNRLNLPNARAALYALGLGIVARHAFIDLSKVLSAEDRIWSIGAKDFVFNALVEETPATGDDNPVSWIETLEFYSHYLDSSSDTQVSGSVTRP